MYEKTLAPAGLRPAPVHHLPLASAACSPEEAQKKANEFAAAVQKKSQADPQGYAKIMQELQPQLLKLQQEQNLENMCKFYDDASEKLK